MNYLISMFDCVVFCEDYYHLKKGAKYQIVEMGKNCGIVYSNNKTLPFVLDIKNSSENVLKVEYKQNSYIFLFPTYYNSLSTTKIRYQNKDLIVFVSDKIVITCDGELICEKFVDNLKYSHFEIIENICLIYFEGKRNFIVAIKQSELVFANYYDEYNENETEKYFMFRLNDSLNHGKVCCIKNKEISTYLVYLDDEELKLKSTFVPFVFLDCVIAGNNSYCKQLLSNELKDVENIEEFFPKFSSFYPIDDKTFILLNKNTLAGIFEFDIENNIIKNIIACHYC